MLESVVVIARPPRMKPTRLAAKSTRRREIPAWFINAPARMNSGTATIWKLSVPLNRHCATITRGVDVVSAMTTMPGGNQGIADGQADGDEDEEEREREKKKLHQSAIRRAMWIASITNIKAAESGITR